MTDDSFWVQPVTDTAREVGDLDTAGKSEVAWRGVVVGLGGGDR